MNKNKGVGKPPPTTNLASRSSIKTPTKSHTQGTSSASAPGPSQAATVSPQQSSPAPKSATNSPKGKGVEDDKDKPDLKDGLLPDVNAFPEDGRLRSNHFQIVHLPNHVLYRYSITQFREPKKEPKKGAESKPIDETKEIKSPKAQTSKSGTAAGPRASNSTMIAIRENGVSASPSAGPTTPGRQTPGNNPVPGGNAPGVDQVADLKSRKRRRLIVLLLDNLNAHDPNNHVASNYIDKLISRRPITYRQFPDWVEVPCYDEDDVTHSNTSIRYRIRIGSQEAIEIGRLSQYLLSQQTMTAAGFTTQADVEAARNAAADALNIVLSDHANRSTVRRANAAPFQPADRPWRSTEPTVTAVGSNKFFPYFNSVQFDGTHAIDIIEVNDTHPWAVDGNDHLAALGGFFRSAKAIFHSSLLLNVHTTTSAFYKWIDLWPLIDAHFPDGRSGWRDLENFVKGLRVRTKYMIDRGIRDHERIYTISGLAGTYKYHNRGTDNTILYPWGHDIGPHPVNCSFTKRTGDDDPGTEVSVHNHYASMQNGGIELLDNDVVVRMGKTGPMIPISQLRVLPGQFWSEKTQLVRNAQRAPDANYRQLIEAAPVVFGWTPGQQQTTLGTRFGLTLRTGHGDRVDPIEVRASRFDQPAMTYANDREVTENPWNMQNRAAIRGAADGQPRKTWTLQQVRRQREHFDTAEHLDAFVTRFGTAMTGFGMNNIAFWPVSAPDQQNPQEGRSAQWARSAQILEPDFVQAEQTLTTRLTLIKRARPDLAFVIVLLPKRDTDLYTIVKRAADLNVNINVVCCVRKKPRQPGGAVRGGNRGRGRGRGRGGRGGQQGDQPRQHPEITTDANIIANMQMKINLKSHDSSIDRRLTDRSALLSEKTMVVGMDVTHSGRSGVPSIAAMVASHDKDFNQWPASIKGNPHRDERNEGETSADFRKANEEITRLGLMLRERLECYQRHNNDELPDRIIFYRDGLSDGQFDMCRTREIPRLRAAIEAKYPANAQPKIMVVCAVKCHSTRFFRVPGTDNQLTDGNGQLLHGTVIYEGVTEGKYQDFFLASQVALLGTCRPTHYVVLHSDFGNEFNVTDVARATYELCFLFGRCCVSVGVVPPAYYADKACDRARFYARQWYTGQAAFPGNIQALDFDLGDLRDRMFYL